MFRTELTDCPPINTATVYPPKIDIDEGPNNSAVINLWRSRFLSKKYTGDIADFLTNKVAELFRQGFDKVEIDCGSPSKTIFGYRLRTSQAEKDASFFSSPETLYKISSLANITISATQHTDKVRDYDGTGQHIFVTLKIEGK